MLHTIKTSNMLFYFDPMVKFSNGHTTDARHHLDVTREDILWQMLSCCGLTFFYV